MPAELHRSLPQIRGGLRGHQGRGRSQSVRNISVLYDFLKYKAEQMTDDFSSSDHQDEIYSEVCNRGCHPTGCSHGFQSEHAEDAPQNVRHRQELSAAHFNSLRELDIHNFRGNRRSVLQPSVFHGINASTRSSELSRKNNPERASNRIYLKRNETPRQSRVPSSVSASFHDHFPPPPREVQFQKSANLPAMPASETVEIIIGSHLGSRTALQKSLSVENLDDSVADSDAFDVFQRTRSGNFTKNQLSLAKSGNLSTFKAAAGENRMLPPGVDSGDDSDIFCDTMIQSDVVLY